MGTGSREENALKQEFSGKETGLSKIGLTDEERALVALVAKGRDSRLRTFFDAFVWYVPLFAFGFYGLAIKDVSLIFLCLVFLAALIVWALFSASAERQRLVSILVKLDAFERAGDPAQKPQEHPPQPGLSGEPGH